MAVMMKNQLEAYEGLMAILNTLQWNNLFVLYIRYKMTSKRGQPLNKGRRTKGWVLRVSKFAAKYKYKHTEFSMLIVSW